MMKLVLLPGMDGTGKLFNPLINELSEQVDAVVLIYPQEQAMTYSDLTDWVLSNIPTDEEFVLLGESFSGPIAFEITTKDLPNLIGTIFVATFLQNPQPSLTWLASMIPLKYALRLRPSDFITKKILLGNNASKPLISAFWQTVKQVPIQVLQKRIKLIAGLSPPKNHIKKPCSYIGGADDLLVSNKNITPFKMRCANLTEHVVAGPHFLLQAKPKRCAEVIEQEISRFERLSSSS